MQAKLVCPRFAHLHNVGVKVLHVRTGLSIPKSGTVWSPDGETIAHVNRSTTADPFADTVLLTSIASGCQLTVVPPATPILATCTFWTPNSQLLISLSGARASFVDRQTGACRLQQVSQLQRVKMRLNGLHCAMCSRARLVVVAQLGQHQGTVSICALVGAPRTVLRVMRQISTGIVVSSLEVSPCGLFATWVDFGSDLNPGPPGGFLVRGRARVQVVELATGRCATLYRTRPTILEWVPMPTAATFHQDHVFAIGVGVSWAPSGTTLHVSGPWGHQDSCMPQQRIYLLP